MQLHHLALRTRDVTRCAAFYRDIFGLTARGEQLEADGSLRSVWLAADSVMLMIEKAEAGEPGVQTGSLELMAFTVGKNECESWRGRLASLGIAIESETEFSLYFRDPDGRRVAVSNYLFE